MFGSYIYNVCVIFQGFCGDGGKMGMAAFGIMALGGADVCWGDL
jgi:hypothetical protein